jgi:hypothetical protein
MNQADAAAESVLSLTNARDMETDWLQSGMTSLGPKDPPRDWQLSVAPADLVQSATHSDTLPIRSKIPANPGTGDWYP